MRACYSIPIILHFISLSSFLPLFSSCNKSGINSKIGLFSIKMQSFWGDFFSYQNNGLASGLIDLNNPLSTEQWVILTSFWDVIIFSWRS